MARRPRIHYPGGLYHVIARGNRGLKVFREDRDYRLYLKFLEEYKERYGFLLYAYVLMPTHIHLLVEVREVPLSRLMQSLQFRYTKNYNLRYQSWGHLFQGRYKAILCEKDSYLIELTAYIHLNPVRAKLTKDPSEYPWSSYREYLKGGKGELADSSFVLSQFSDIKGRAVREYVRFVEGQMPMGHREELYRLRDQRFLGDEGFIDRVVTDRKDGPSYIYDLPIQELVGHVSTVFGISVETIWSMSRNRAGAWGRAIIGYLGRWLCGYSNKYVSDYFNRDPVTVSRGVAKVEERTRWDKEFETKLQRLEEEITRGRRRKIRN
ncbi:MAG: transposase [Syntrophaceae bacterium]|nr:transposase [Syntrophaceae bacterium]